MNEQSNPINHALRGHVTRIGFDLSLRQTHIAALVLISERLKAPGQFIDTRHASTHGRIFGLFAPGAQGLITRGLVTHDGALAAQRRTSPEIKFADCWALTRAGELAVELLKEAGIYAEYADALPAPYQPTWGTA